MKIAEVSKMEYSNFARVDFFHRRYLALVKALGVVAARLVAAN
jgi:hypothetical protein